ncbi:hypothetical protein C0J52_05103 [Blattella germanica]|nr:hypothetical protein C0J52_05103 [Blattella germanica]
MVEKLFPNISHPSVIVLDSALYHSVQENKPPSKYAVKQEMMKWLQDNKIKFSADMKKDELFELIQRFKPQEKTYHIDKLISMHGHIALRLPPYMCELTAIELAWAAIKCYVREHNMTSDLSLTRLQQETENAVISITPADWEGYISHVKKLKDEFRQKDGLMEYVMESLIISAGGIDSSDKDNISEESHSDSELARPLSN